MPSPGFSLDFDFRYREEPVELQKRMKGIDGAFGFPVDVDKRVRLRQEFEIYFVIISDMVRTENRSEPEVRPRLTVFERE